MTLVLSFGVTISPPAAIPGIPGDTIFSYRLEQGTQGMLFSVPVFRCIDRNLQP